MVHLGRVKNENGGLVVSLPRPLIAALAWKGGDRVAWRLAGEKLIGERVPLEQLAVLRTGESEASR